MKPAVTTAVLLAAGRGQRLRPYTDHTPKPLLPVDDRPTLDFVLTAAASAGIAQVCLVTHHLGGQIEQYVGDGTAWDMQAFFCRQTQLRGTAHALQTAVAAFPALFDAERPFLLTATDYVLPPAYLADLIRAHAANGTDMTFSLKQLPPAELIRSSTVQFQENGFITRVIEKPAPADIVSPVAASLTFVLPADTVDYLRYMQPSPRGEFEIQSIINQMLQDGYTASGLVQETPREWAAPDDRTASV